MDILNETYLASFSTHCLLCNEEIPLYCSDNTIRVCERWKNAWKKMRDVTEEKRIKELLEELEQTEEGRLIAKGYKDFCLNKNNKI